MLMPINTGNIIGLGLAMNISDQRAILVLLW